MLTLSYTHQKSTKNSDTPLTFSQGKKSAERGLKKAATFETARQKYLYTLDKYLKLHYSFHIPPIFQYPTSYFVYYDNSLHFRKDIRFPLFLDIENTFMFALHVPCSKNYEIEKNLLYALQDLFRILNTLSKHEQACYRYEEKYQHPFPFSEYIYIESMIYRWWISPTNNCEFLPFTTFLAELKGTPAEQKCLDELAILKSMKNKNLLPSFVMSKAENPYYIHLDFFGKKIALKYHKDYHKFQCTIPAYSTTDFLHSTLYYNQEALINQDISSLFHNIGCPTGFNFHFMPTNTLTHFLFSFINGNYQLLINLAILFANIASPEILTPKLFLITYKKSDTEFFVSESFLRFFKSIFNTTGNANPLVYNSIGEFLRLKNAEDIHHSFYKGNKYLMIYKGSSRLSELQIKKLRQYITGSKLSYTNKIYGSVSFKNVLPIICFSDNHKDTAFLEQNVPCIKIDISHINDFTEIMPNPNTSAEIYSWLRTYLPLYGLFLLAEKHFHQVPLPKYKNLPHTYSPDSIINDFMNMCCKYNSKSFTYADTLYEAYTIFYQEHYKSIPLKRSQFVSAMKRISKITYKRPHVSRSEPNKYAFIGISLLPDWQEKISIPDDALSLDEEALKHKLEEISTLMPPPPKL